jgi:hypothetical protein
MKASCLPSTNRLVLVFTHVLRKSFSDNSRKTSLFFVFFKLSLNNIVKERNLQDKKIQFATLNQISWNTIKGLACSYTIFRNFKGN